MPGRQKLLWQWNPNNFANIKKKQKYNNKVFSLQWTMYIIEDLNEKIKKKRKENAHYPLLSLYS